MGGLAPDNDTPMPVEMQKSIEGYWRKIEAMLGTRFNYNFWTECEPRRDTYKACRAVLVAARHGLEEDMILAIQQAYYLNAKNPSNIETLVDLATEMNLDGPDFRRGLQSEETEVQFKQQRALAQRLGVNGFPTLRLKIENSIYPVTLDYNDHSVSLKEIEKISRLQ